jgi:hypothetical protein
MADFASQSVSSQVARATSPLAMTTDASCQTSFGLPDGLPLVYIADLIIEYQKLAEDLDSVVDELHEFAQGLEVSVYVAKEGRSQNRSEFSITEELHS